MTPKEFECYPKGRKTICRRSSIFDRPSSMRSVFTSREERPSDLSYPNLLKKNIDVLDLDGKATYQAYNEIANMLKEKRKFKEFSQESIIGLAMFIANPFLHLGDVEDFANVSLNEMELLEETIGLHRPKIGTYVKNKFKFLQKSFPNWTMDQVMERLKYLSGKERFEIREILTEKPTFFEKKIIPYDIFQKIVVNTYNLMKEGSSPLSVKKTLRKYGLNINNKRIQLIEHIFVVLKAIFDQDVIATIEDLHDLGVNDAIIKKILTILEDKTSFDIDARFPKKDSLYYMIKRIMAYIERGVVTKIGIKPLETAMDKYGGILMPDYIFMHVDIDSGLTDFSKRFLEYLKEIQWENSVAKRFLKLLGSSQNENGLMDLIVFKLYKEKVKTEILEAKWSINRSILEVISDKINEIKSKKVFLLNQSPLIMWINFQN